MDGSGGVGHRAFLQRGIFPRIHQPLICPQFIEISLAQVWLIGDWYVSELASVRLSKLTPCISGRRQFFFTLETIQIDSLGSSACMTDPKSLGTYGRLGSVCYQNPETKFKRAGRVIKLDRIFLAMQSALKTQAATAATVLLSIECWCPGKHHIWVHFKCLGLWFDEIRH